MLQALCIGLQSNPDKPESPAHYVVCVSDINKKTRNFYFKTEAGASYFARYINTSKILYIFKDTDAEDKLDESFNSRIRRAIIAVQFMESHPDIRSVARQAQAFKFIEV